MAAQRSLAIWPSRTWVRKTWLMAWWLSAARFSVTPPKSTAFIAFIARATDPRYTATQFALFTSLAAVPRTVVNASTGWVVEQTGWFTFFLVCAVLALPGMALLLRVAPWGERAGDKPAQ